MRAALKNAAALLVFLALLAAWGLIFGCPIKRLTGLPCPGCGLTRGCLALLRLDFADALRWHPLAFAVPPLCAMFVLKDTRAGGRFWGSAPLLAGLIALILAVYAARMALMFPGSPPMNFYGGAVFVRLAHKLLLH